MSSYSLCCCMSIQTGIIILAIIDAVYNGIILALCVTALMLTISIETDETDHPEIQMMRTELIVVSVIGIILAFCRICLAVYLIRSAKKRNYYALRKWMIIFVFLFVFPIILIAFRIYNGTTDFDLSFSIIKIAFRLFVIFMVYAFMKEITMNGEVVNDNCNDNKVAFHGVRTSEELPIQSNAAPKYTELPNTMKANG